MRRAFVVSAACILLCLCSLAQADVFHMGTGFTSLQTVAVGQVGNLRDGHTGLGSVGYNYSIGKYEVTAGQYCDFLSHKANVSDPHGLYNSEMWNDSLYGCRIQQSGSSGDYIYTVADDYANRPVNYVSFWDACRFANWLGNGQGDGDTETGAYTLTPDGIANNTVTRNANWTWAVTDSNEWFKAAYYATTSAVMGGPGYWLYPTQSNGINSRMANFNTTSPLDSVMHTTNVGAYGNPSEYGTYDQGGNVAEWSDSIIRATYRGLLGGSWTETYFQLQRINNPYWDDPPIESGYVGFRVSAVPEPASLLALLAGLAGVGCFVRRRRT